MRLLLSIVLGSFMFFPTISFAGNGTLKAVKRFIIVDSTGKKLAKAQDVTGFRGSSAKLALKVNGQAFILLLTDSGRLRGGNDKLWFDNANCLGQPMISVDGDKPGAFPPVVITSVPDPSALSIYLPDPQGIQETKTLQYTIDNANDTCIDVVFPDTVEVVDAVPVYDLRDKFTPPFKVVAR